MEEYGVMPFREENNVPIVLACDDKYVPYTSVLLSSLRENASDDKAYDVLLFQRDVTPENQLLLRSCFAGKENMHIRFINVSGEIKNLRLRTFGYYNEAIYYRLFAPWILKEYDKILYFDCDLVFDTDVAELYEIDLGGNYLGAVRDIGMLLHASDPDDKAFSDYFAKRLNGLDPTGYFNSGVLLMDLKAFREKIGRERMKKAVDGKNYRFPDQDVLNVLCAGKTLFLGQKWNVVPETLGGRTVKNIRRFVPAEYAEEYVAARENPAVVHYAMKEKPWNYSLSLDFPLGRYFWRYAFVSPLKSVVLSRKGKTCPFSELYAIICLFDGEKFVYKRKNGSIRAYYGEDEMGTLFRQTIAFDSVKTAGEDIRLEGVFKMSEPELRFCKTMVLSSGEREYPVVIERKEELIEGTGAGAFTLHFSVNVPIRDVTEERTFSFLFRTEERVEKGEKFSYGRWFPLDRKTDRAYYVVRGVCLTAGANTLTFRPAEKAFLMQRERELRKQIRSVYPAHARKILLKRALYHAFKKVYKRELWLFSDRLDQAGDNGEALFAYVREHKPKNVTAVFAVKKDSPDFRRMKKVGKTVAVDGYFYKLLKLVGDKFISSHCEGSFAYLYREGVRDIAAKRAIVFLQHGITKDDVSDVYGKKVKNFDLFVTAANPEYESILHTPGYGYSEEEVKDCGFPRFDKLVDRAERIVTIMPTWRKGYVYKTGEADWTVKESFAGSAYVAFYNALLSDERLLSYVRTNGYVLQFVPHPLMKSGEKYLRVAEDVVLPENKPYSGIFSESAVLVTDYSSTAFDFAYLRKPIVYCQFDKEEFFASHTYTEGYFDYERDGFGEVTTTVEQTVDAIIRVLENGGKTEEKYKKRADAFFRYDDRNNCARTLKEIEKIRK